MNEDRTPAPGVNAIDFYRKEIDQQRAAVKILNEEIDRLQGQLNISEGCYQDEIDRLRAENAELGKAIREYACTGTDEPCGCHLFFIQEKAELDRLRSELAAAHKFMDRDVEDYEALRAELKDCESSHKEMSGAYENASVEAERLRAEVHEANAACDAQIRECYHLSAKNAELRSMLISLRQELKGYEMAATGESYNNTELNALIAKTAKEGL